MRVIFVTSGNSSIHRISPFTLSQGESLRGKGVEVEYFPIVGKGSLNYLKNAITLRKQLREKPVDLIHAHYSLSGWVAVLGSRGLPVVLSLMGDDAQGTAVEGGKITFQSRVLRYLTKMIQPFVKAIISKSNKIAGIVYRKNISFIIPNGVQLNQFRIFPGGLRKELGLDTAKKYVLFLGSPEDPNKNFRLVKEAVKMLNRQDVELLNIYKAPHEEVVRYLNSVDVFTLCSYLEGSANVVKEAMACNCPMVVTDAGDAAWIIGKTQGCYLSTFDPARFASDLEKALCFAETTGRTRGRERIVELGLDADSVADKIIKVYQSVLNK